MKIGNVLSSVGNKLAGKFGKTGLILKAKSPEILIGAGVVLVLGGTYMACRATAKAKEVLQERKNEIDEIKYREAEEIGEINTTENIKAIQKEARSDIFVANVKCGWELTKLYAPAIALEAAGIGCFLGAHGIMRKRNAALMAAYEATDKAYRRLKEQQDQKLLTDGKTEEKKSEDKKEEKEGCPFNPNLGPWSFVFDRNCDCWHNSATDNQMLAKCVEKIRTSQLNAGRTIFLNDIRTDFGMDNPGVNYEGQTICWSKEFGDTEIDLGLTFSPYDKEFWINPQGGHPIEKATFLRRR